MFLPLVTNIEEKFTAESLNVFLLETTLWRVGGTGGSLHAAAGGGALISSCSPSETGSSAALAGWELVDQAGL